MPRPSKGRPRLTCDSCTQAKTSCDKSKPACGRCVTRQSDCQYPPDTSIVTSQHADDDSSVRPAQPALTTLPETLEENTRRHDADSQAVSEQTQVLSMLTLVESSRLQHGLLEQTDQTLPVSTGILLRQGGGREHYFNPLHWTALCDEAGIIGAVYSTDDLAIPNELSKNLLNKETCDRCVEAYISNCHPIQPMIHIPTFRANYAEFWTQDLVSGTFPALMLAIIFAGALSNKQVDAPYYRDLALDMVNMAGFPIRTSMDTLRAYLICHFTSLREEDVFMAASSLAPALQAADILGLDLDSSRLKVQVDKFEERRCTWLHLAYIDSTIAFAAGFRPRVDLGDGESLTERKDIDVFHRHAHAEYILHPSRSTTSILAAAKLETMLAQRRLLRKLRGNISWGDLYEMEKLWALLDTSLTSKCHEISSRNDNSMLDAWAQHIIAIFSDQYYYLFCYPYLSDQIHKMPLHFYNQAITSCLCTLIRCAELSSNPDYERFSWSWPGNHQPIHPLMVAIKHVQLRADPLARKVVDVIFALSAQRGGLTSGTDFPSPRVLSHRGIELWGIIRRFRASVWSKLDWEAELYWSRRRAMECVRAELLPALKTMKVSYPNMEVVLNHTDEPALPPSGVMPVTSYSEDFAWADGLLIESPLPS